MTINAGVWIDHHKAVVVLFSDEREDIRQIMCDPVAPARSSGEALVKSSYTPNDFVAEDKRERKAMIHLNKFYDEVIACLRDADAILVLGPGEAKGEFTKRMEGQKLKGRIAHVGTVDKMTDGEIAAHVRQLLGIGSPRAQSTEAKRT
jgi:hypothetical protein